MIIANHKLQSVVILTKEYFPIKEKVFASSLV